MTAELTPLAAVCAQTAPATRSFTVAVQHIATGKRMPIGGASSYGTSSTGSRVASYHVVHVADPTKSFFKVLCWGDTLPAFGRDDHDGSDDITTICVGDIVLFSACTVKAFRGNVEAQYTRHSSVQLLYRRDRYFNTRDVRIKELFPMIEWYKTQRQAFLSEGVSGSTRSAGSVAFTAICDLREDSLVNLRGTIRAYTAPREAPPLPHSASDFDSVQLCEVTIEDAPTSSMVLNLWDQHTEPRFVTRLRAHRGLVAVIGVVISRNADANRLFANTTPRTAFRFDSEHDDALPSASSLHDGRVVLEGVIIEHVLLGRVIGESHRVTAAATLLLVECYCTVCDQTMPINDTTTIPHTYTACKSQCRVQPDQNEHAWRYRTVRMVLRDAKQHRRTVWVESPVLTRLLGNIHADLLVHPHGPKGAMLPFDARVTVATLLNSLVHGTLDPQVYEAELERRQSERGYDDRRGSLTHSMNDSERHDDDDAEDSTLSEGSYTLTSLTATIECPW